MELPRVGRGKRAVLSGRTGSGKTTLARWLLRRSPGSWLVLNTKHDAELSKLPNSATFSTPDYDAWDEAWNENKFVIYEPTGEDNNPEALDALIEYIHKTYEQLGLYVDELYMINNGAKAGPGLTGWLTRGRSIQQSFIGCTQRPAWISRFCFSEADYFGMMALNLLDDRKRLYEFVGHDEVLTNPPRPHSWRWYDVSKDLLLTYGPVPEST